MLTVEPTLLIGPSDWSAPQMPRAEFEGRIAALWRNAGDASRAIVFGNRRHHAELAYFTNFVPKLEPAVALISRSSEHRLFVGSPNMIGAARPLTFLEYVLPMKDMAAAVAGERQPTLVIGADYAPPAMRKTLTEAIDETFAREATQQAWSLMRRKSRYELDCLDAAVKAAGAARKAMRQNLASANAPVTAAVLAGERAAIAAGAQDVRLLVSLDGGRTLRPFTAPIEQALDPFMVYVAVRRFNYWGESVPLFAAQSQLSPVTAAAWGAMRSALTAIKPDVAIDRISELTAATARPYQPHPVTGFASVQRMGLALDGPCCEPGATFEEGEVYALRIGVVAEHGIICSCIFHLCSDGIQAFDDGVR
jgi:hypothetical protein